MTTPAAAPAAPWSRRRPLLPTAASRRTAQPAPPRPLVHQRDHHIPRPVIRRRPTTIVTTPNTPNTTTATATVAVP